jgi:hypothetical protein
MDNEKIYISYKRKSNLENSLPELLAYAIVQIILQCVRQMVKNMLNCLTQKWNIVMHMNASVTP